ncbi:DoxX family protein [Nonomuraea sp. C10]|uniref:DoxX family protein n=1 Tax=Nonomuraea sp. C10 TaxID=2600577 RepID=UPI0011CEC984|nr:DoxX family protein [Nonomuraea sp. C10]TXK41018.1 DoxX family protein [Nonomuraea sp. C10]
MNLALWIVAGLLAAVFGVAGLMKLAQPKERLAAAGLAWTEDFSVGAVKAIGGLEVLAALGLILPATFGVVPILTPLAAAGLVIVMIGAAVTHGRRGEHPAIAVNVVLLVLAAFVAWGRFGPHAF